MKKLNQIKWNFVFFLLNQGRTDVWLEDDNVLYNETQHLFVAVAVVVGCWSEATT